jgi:hypothetical protein
MAAAAQSDLFDERRLPGLTQAEGIVTGNEERVHRSTRRNCPPSASTDGWASA